MKDKYMDLKAEFQDTIDALAGATGWPVEQTEKVLELLVSASAKRARLTSAQCHEELKKSRVYATKILLKNYRQFKWSIETGLEHSLRLLEDREFQRLMQMEESVENQSLRSTALLTAGNRVLWAQLNAALDCFREYCDSSSSQQTKRQYRIIYERYLAPQEKPVQDIVELLHIERSHFFRGVQEAVNTLSVMLFGSRSVEDFILSGAREGFKARKQ